MSDAESSYLRQELARKVESLSQFEKEARKMREVAIMAHAELTRINTKIFVKQETMDALRRNLCTCGQGANDIMTHKEFCELIRGMDKG